VRLQSVDPRKVAEVLADLATAGANEPVSGSILEIAHPRTENPDTSVTEQRAESAPYRCPVKIVCRPAFAGEHGDVYTHSACARLVRSFALKDEPEASPRPASEAVSKSWRR
jgi:hypothetical protein